MLSAWRRCLFVTAVIASVVGGRPVADSTAGGGNPFAFFEPDIVVSPPDRHRLDSGETLVRVLPGSGGQVAVFAASRVNATPEQLIARMRDIEGLKRSRFAPVVRRFSDPPALGDLAELTLDDGDVTDLRACRPGDCGVKLGAAEIDTVTHAAAAAGQAWRDRVQLEFRAIVRARAAAYRARGFDGLSSYDDRSSAVRPSAVHATIVRAAPFLREADAGGGESFLYWAQERAAGKTIVTVSHVTLVAGGTPSALVISRQVYASHYMSGAIGVTALVQSDDLARLYLVYVNRTHLDVMGGFLAPVKRAIIEGRVATETAGVFTELRRRIERMP
jgi:hypothetical protein